jgi:hypothetical protein
MTSAENLHAGQGPVLLDVGGDVGALLVTMPPSLEGVEIEIRSCQQGLPARTGDHREGSHVTHVEVLPRLTTGGVVHSAVFPSLVQGRYELYERPSGPVRLQVTITGGQVTQLAWPR